MSGIDGTASYNFGTVDNKVTIKAPDKATADKTQALLEKVDANHDGTISREEWADSAKEIASFQRQVETVNPTFKFDLAGAGATRFSAASTQVKTIDASLANIDAQADELRLTADTKTSGPVHESFLAATYNGSPVTTTHPQINPEGGGPAKFATLKEPILTPDGEAYVKDRQAALHKQYDQVRADIQATNLPDSDKQALLAKVDASEAKMNANVAKTFETSQNRKAALDGTTIGHAEDIKAQPKYNDHFEH